MTDKINSFLKDEGKPIAIIVDGIEYHISAFFSLHHAEIFLNALSEGGSARRALACVISDKLCDDGHDVSTDIVETLPEDSFEELIAAIIDDDDSLRNQYDKTDTRSPAVERFALAYKAYWEQINVVPDGLKQMLDDHRRFTEQLKPEIEALSQIQKIIGQSPTFQISQAAQAAMESFQAISLPTFELPMISAAQAVVDSLQAVPRPTFDTAIISAAQQVSQVLGDYAQSSLFNAAQQAAQAAASIVGPIQESLGHISSMLANTIASLQFPELSEERKKELIDSHIKWGEYGWSMLPHAHIKLFYTCPDTSAEADKIALSYYNKAGVNQLFVDLREKRVRKKDLDEAIICFENRQYTACALILFALIDAKLIRLQPKPQDDKRRKTGAGAIFHFKKKFKANNNIDMLFFRAFRYFNLFKCLEKMFEDTRDFNLDVHVVNRNYVGHGMNRRQTRRKDCIQLFLVLYNLLSFLELESM